MKNKLIITMAVLLLCGFGYTLYQKNKPYPKGRELLQELFTDTKRDIRIINEDNGEDITEWFVKKYQDKYQEDGVDAIINEFAKQNYSMTYKNDDNVVNTEN